MISRERIRSTWLPQFFRFLPKRFQSQFDSALDQIDAPFESIDAQLSSMYREVCYQSQSLDSAGYLKAIHGIDAQNWPGSIVGRLLPKYALYCRLRGTLRGLRLATELIFETSDFEIEERSFPKPLFRIGESRLNSTARSARNDVLERSLIIRLKVVQNPISKSLISDYRTFLEKEIPGGLKSYFLVDQSQNDRSQKLKTSQRLPSPWHFRIGDRL